MKIPQYSKLFCAVLATMTPALLASSFGQTNVAYSDAERMNKQGSGDWAYDGGSDSAFNVGDSSTAGRTFETAVLINISSFDAEIAAASSISFNIAYSDVLGAGQDVTAYVFGTDATALSGTNSIGPISFHNSGVGGSSAGTILAGNFSAPGVATYDVTTIVQGLTAFDSVGILLTANATQSGSADDIVFYRENTLGSQLNGGAYLTIVPEPGTFALLAGLTGLACVMMRRRS
ncbi:PEP-CTERM sorting domain-containing protein [Coraliomargarita sp. SDUM461003]|uniref:PEP-CTERM sorting domain-containing protein n=1 Tax=Thalassobacterium maritimum TaxID=3041265 RepID=A0ABU1B041_9BACT|nr:PEP-CTERM sorting domain-containing protein [Coraliomargarita sp. SDUM461003]MDQ8208582.1 PEP-CTERM sorting domain-containing protein [Coraliomargarita sp. SDUM461003]